MRQCENCGAYLDPEERCDCEQERVPDKEIVQVLQKEFSGYDQPLHSKVKNPDKYGIMRIPRAERILRRAFPRATRKRPVKENRKRGNKHTPSGSTSGGRAFANGHGALGDRASAGLRTLGISLVLRELRHAADPDRKRNGDSR